jgi:hypothetical protein
VLRVFCIITLICLPASAVSGADVVLCPPELNVTQRLAAPVPGWSVASDGLPHWLAGLTFFDGKPEDKASLAPDKQTKLNGRTIASWTFDAGGRPVWVACHYSGTDVMLTRELPKTARTCAVTYSARDTIAGLSVIEKVDCK